MAKWINLNPYKYNQWLRIPTVFILNNNIRILMSLQLLDNIIIKHNVKYLILYLMDFSRQDNLYDQPNNPVRIVWRE